MEMNIWNSRKFIFACFVLVGCVQDVWGSGQIEVQFSSYSDSCREDFSTSKCDPKFTFCYGRPKSSPSVGGTDCQYLVTRQTNHWQDTNYITFNGDMKGVSNPLIAAVSRFQDPSVMLAVHVRDDDTFDDDNLVTLSTTLSTIYPSKEDSKWLATSMSQSSYRMNFQYRMYCDAYYYTQSCDVYCKPQETSSGHYTCHPSTGAKICSKGWKGANCDQDIDECALRFCARGECQNSPGDYTCKCPEYYTGKNCSELMSPCTSSPCLNGGTCFAHSSQYTYICKCIDGWQGINCETRIDPCSKAPCENGGNCIASPGETTYKCECPESYHGQNCHLTVTTTTTTTTTEATSPTTTETTTPTTMLITTSSPATTSQLVTTTLPTTTLPSTTSSTTGVHTTKEPERNLFETASSLSTALPSASTDEVFAYQSHAQTEDEPFPAWQAGVIALGVALACLILVAILIFRRRRNKKNLREESATIGSNLRFENNMYNKTNRNNLAIETETDNPPVRPISVISHTGKQEAANPTYAEVDESLVSDAGYSKIGERLTRCSQNCDVKSTPTLPDKVEQNNYADFKTLKSQARMRNTDTERVEPVYQDLDSVDESINTKPLPTFRADSNGSVAIDLFVSEDEKTKGLPSEYDTPLSCAAPPRMQRSLPPVPAYTAAASGYDVPRNQTLKPAERENTEAVMEESSDEDDEISQEDLAKLRKEVEDKLNLAVTIKGRGESTT